MPFLRINRQRKIALRQGFFGDERNIHRRWIPDRLGQQTDLIMKVWTCTQATVPPGRVVRSGARCDARLSFHRKPAVHCSAYFVQQRDDQGIELIIERITKWWGKHHGAAGPGLMVVVDYLRKPLAEKNPVNRFRFRQRRHVEVPVIVVPRVFVVETRNICDRTLCGVGRFHIPVRHQLHAIGIHEAVENNDVIQETHCLGIGAVHELINIFDKLLRAEHFRGVQPAIDPHDGFSFSSQRSALVFVQTLGRRQAPGDFFVSRKIFLVFTRRNDCQIHVPAFG